MKFVLVSNSNTQRVTAKIEDTSVLLTKEYRKSEEEPWKIGKGITIPVDKLIFLGNLLEFNDEEIISRRLTGYEVIEEADE